MDWHDMKIAQVNQEGQQMRHLTLTSDAALPFSPGQYVQVQADGQKPGFFALTGSPESPDRPELLIKQGGGVADLLYAAKPGDVVQVSAPQGPGFPAEHLLGKNVLLIGVGSGLAPLRSVLLSILANRADYGERVMLVYGARTPFDIPFRPEIVGWRAHVEVYKAMSQPGDADWSGYVGYVQHLLADLDIPAEQTTACLCGMSPMVDGVKAALADMGIAEDDVYLNF